MSILVVDFDGLKHVNDVLGYDRGDALISLIGASLQKNLREQDLAVRLGGDEFIVLLPHTDERIALMRAEESGSRWTHSGPGGHQAVLPRGKRRLRDGRPR